jgi:hypothetical protein
MASRPRTQRPADVDKSDILVTDLLQRLRMYQEHRNRSARTFAT